MRLTFIAFAIGCLVVVGAAGCGTEAGTEGSGAVTDENTTRVQPSGGSEGAADESTSGAPSGEATVDVVESGFTQKKDNLLYGLVLENTSGVGASEVAVTANVLDANGDVIADDNPDISVIPAGERFNVGGEISLEPGGKAEELEVTVDVGDSASDDFVLPKVENVRVAKDEFGLTLTVRGQVTNNLSEPLSSLTDVFVVFRDSNGEIVGGTQSLPIERDVQPGRRAAIELSTFTVLNSVASADVTVDNEISSS